MFQDMNKMFEESMGPFKNMLDIQTQMLERLTQQQIECTQACFQATMQQAMDLQKVTSPTELASLQMDYTKKLEETMAAANQQNMQALKDAHEAMQSLTLSAVESLKPKE